MNVISREYKAMLAPDRFEDRSSGAAQFWAELQDLAKSTGEIRAKGELDRKATRTVAFLDTADFTLKHRGLILRQRTGDEGVQYTLKCRSEDRYFAAGTDLRAADGHRAKQKLEEDIAPPFRCRFSHSTTVDLPDADTPKTLGDAADIFPILGKLRVDAGRCPPDTPLRIVNNTAAYERAYNGAKLIFDRKGDWDDTEEASVALILWSDGKEGRPLVAEASFRLKDTEERFSRELAATAREFYSLMQRLDWCRADGMTKTEYIYRGAAGH